MADTDRDGPFHAGELAMQARAGAGEQALANAAMIRSDIAAGARPFFAKQSLLVVASEDAAGTPWASVVLGEPPFASVAEGGARLALDLARVVVVPDDPLWANLAAGARIGVLAIELETRRRFRVNGRVAAVDAKALEVEVLEAFPNCPKYIVRRVSTSARAAEAPGPSEHGTGLDAQRRELLAAADTLFLATGNAARGLDASHRGGPAGFARAEAPDRIVIPDYAGNSLFNSLGNVVTEPRLGLAIPDFRRSRVLQVTGTGRVLCADRERPEPAGGTGRWLEVRVERWVEHAAGRAWPAASGLGEPSPFTPLP